MIKFFEGLKDFKNKIMDFDHVKIYGANILAFLSTFTDISNVLKILIMLLTVTYTVIKIIVLIKNEFKKDED